MYSTQGIILKREDFRERDERLCFYTKDFGKLSVVAKGTKRIEAKLRGNLDLFNFVDIIFVEGKYFPILTGVDLKDRFPWIAKDASLYRVALLLAESILRIFEERARDEEFFSILYLAIKKLGMGLVEDSTQSKINLRSWLLWKKFQIAILENQGYGQGQLLTMLQGTEFWDIEEMFKKTFAYFFNYSPPSWIPEIL